MLGSSALKHTSRIQFSIPAFAMADRGHYLLSDPGESMFNPRTAIIAVLIGISSWRAVADEGAWIDEKIERAWIESATDIQDMKGVVTLNVYSVQLNQPQIVGSLNGERDRELKITEGPLHPLRTFLEREKNVRGERFKVLINVNGGISYRIVDMVLRECALAGAAPVCFATQSGDRKKIQWVVLDAAILPGADAGKPDDQIAIRVVSNGGVLMASLPEGKPLSSVKELSEALANLRTQRGEGKTLMITANGGIRLDHVLMTYEAARMAKWERIALAPVKN